MKRGIKIAVLVLILVFLAGLKMPAVLVANAAAIDDLRTQIDQKNQEIQKLEEEIKQYQGDIKEAQSTAKTLKGAISRLDLEIKQLNTQITLTNQKISRTGLEITGLGFDIDVAAASLEKERGLMKNLLFAMAETEGQSALETFLKYGTMASFFDELKSTSDLNEKMRQGYLALQDTKKQFEDKKAAAEKARKDLKGFKQDLSDQQSIQKVGRSTKTNLLKSTKNQEALYQKLYQDRLAKKASLEKEVFDYESQLKFILDPNSLPPSGTAVFDWPLDNIYITQFFGASVAATRLYVSGSHNGVDLAANVGTPVKAMLGGIVLGSGDTDITCPGASFGKWVLIKHNNGLTSIYAHLSLIKVSEGDSISTGQVIGYSGNTGYSTGPHLHISVYAANGVEIQSRPSKSCGGRIYTMPLAPINAYLDPMLYLPPYKS